MQKGYRPPFRRIRYPCNRHSLGSCKPSIPRSGDDPCQRNALYSKITCVTLRVKATGVHIFSQTRSKITPDNWCKPCAVNVGRGPEDQIYCHIKVGNEGIRRQLHVWQNDIRINARSYLHCDELVNTMIEFELMWYGPLHFKSVAENFINQTWKLDLYTVHGTEQDQGYVSLRKQNW